jgi:hypothetical protein
MPNEHSSMIRRFSIKGFKSLQSAELDLGAVNVFIGANGSGKSNLLEALGVMGAAAFRSVEPEALRYRGVRPGLPTLYKSAFKSRPGAARAVSRLISLEVESGDASYRLSLDNPITESTRAWGIHSETLTGSSGTLLTRSPRGYNVHGVVEREKVQRDETFARQAVALSPDDAAEELLRRLSDYAIFTPSTATLRGIEPDITREPLGLGGSGLPTAVRNLINFPERGDFGAYDTDDLWELIDWANQIAVVPAQQTSQSPAVSSGSYVIRFRDKYMKDKRNLLSAYDASEGALYVLFLLSLSTHPLAPRTFAVDNFDHALHPRLAAELIRLVCAGLLDQDDRQMLLTTHNPLVLDGLDLRNDEIRLFAVERFVSSQHASESANPIGATVVRRIKPTKTMLEAAENGLSLSRLWVMGRLGAIPRGF